METAQFKLQVKELSAVWDSACLTSCLYGSADELSAPGSPGTRHRGNSLGTLPLRSIEQELGGSLVSLSSFPLVTFLVFLLFQAN